MRRAGRLLSLIGLSIAAIIGAAILAHAVITSASNKVILAGNGATTVFTFPFVGVAPADLTVIYTDASGNQTTLVQGAGPTQYQVSLNLPAQGSLWGIGGTVTYNPSGTPIANGTTLTVARTLPYTQSVSLQNQASDGQFAKAAEQALDLLEMQIQQVVEAGNRVISIPIVDPAGIITTLPPAAQRANQALVFDGSGNATAGAIPASGVISAPMAPVVGAVSLAAGRTAFGLGAMAVENIGGGLADDGAGNARVLFPLNPIAVNTSITSANYLQKISANAALTLSLPRANTTFSGFGFWVYAFGGAVTLLPDSHDVVQAQTSTSGAPVRIGQGSIVFVYTDGAASGNWLLEWAEMAAKPTAGGSFANLKITNSSPNIFVTADELVMPNTATGTVATGGSIRQTSISLTISLLSSGANGLDTGSVANTTFYSIWAISNGTTLAGLASLSATAPTMPAGYTFRKRLGWVLTTSGGGGALWPTLQYDRDVQYLASGGIGLPVLVNGTTPAYWTDSTPVGVFVPTTSSRIRVILNATLTGATQSAAVAPDGSYGTAPNSNPFPPCGGLTNNTNSTVINQVCDLLLEATTIKVGAVGTAMHLQVLGWRDNL